MSDLRGGEIVIRPRKGWVRLSPGDLWNFRELLFFLSWRNIKVKYKQSLLGVAWVLFKPLATMLLFSLLFGRLAKFPSDGAPYPVFVFLGLLPWLYFSTAVTESTASLVAGSSLISKVYFPRILVPVSTNLSSLFDFFVSFCLLFLLMLYYGIPPGAGMLLSPLFAAFFFVAALGTGLFFSALNVKYRDVGHIVPFFMQLWMFATPVIYPVSFLPDEYRLLMYLNPMAGPIEAFRAVVLGGTPPNPAGLLASLAVNLAVLTAGFFYFKSVERTFADVI